MRRIVLPFAAIVLLMLSTATLAHATTWNEPWMDQVIREADNLVLARVLSYDEHTGAVIRIVRTIAGTPISGEVKINDFYALEICSYSRGHGPEFYFRGIDSSYFFLKKNDSGGYSISTPTSGFAVVQDGNAIATYRHSYHQALVPLDLYERTMKPIFDHYHGLPVDLAFVESHVNRVLSLPPARINETQGETFFAQHVALESIYHLRLPDHYARILPFLHDTMEFHSNVSAARALAAYNTDDATRELMRVVADTTADDFLQVICINTLREFKRPDLKRDLQRIEATASEGMNGFGGSIMDPRVCTAFPTVRQALGALIKEL